LKAHQAMLKRYKEEHPDVSHKDALAAIAAMKKK
jgi:hypothetical protein